MRDEADKRRRSAVPVQAPCDTTYRRRQCTRPLHPSPDPAVEGQVPSRLRRNAWVTQWRMRGAAASGFGQVSMKLKGMYVRRDGMFSGCSASQAAISWQTRRHLDPPRSRLMWAGRSSRWGLYGRLAIAASVALRQLEGMNHLKPRFKTGYVLSKALPVYQDHLKCSKTALHRIWSTGLIAGLSSTGTVRVCC